MQRKSLNARMGLILGLALAGGTLLVPASMVGSPALARASGPTTQEFTYQGKLTQNNAVVNGTADLRFTRWGFFWTGHADRAGPGRQRRHGVERSGDGPAGLWSGNLHG